MTELTKKKSNRRVLIYGTGSGLELTLKALSEENCVIIGVTDKKKPAFPPQSGLEFIALEDIGSLYDYIAIASLSYDRYIIDHLVSIGIPESTIILPLRMNQVDSITLRKKLLRPVHVRAWSEFYGIERISNLTKMQGTCDCLAITSQEAINLNNFNDYSLRSPDYQRLAVALLLSKRIQELALPGDVAELGVYQGDFSTYLSSLFPDRKLHLFDTFTGFPDASLACESSEDVKLRGRNHFSDTSLDLVRSKLTEHSAEIFFYPGYFPETAPNKDIRYCFVSIDVDLYQPTIDGLKFFYEHITPGGYIMLHDYNFSLYPGVKQAVHEFCEEQGVAMVPISDFYGSVIIPKPTVRKQMK
ncbi:MAG: TylF/MycF family methyltransferase [Alkalimonas sp.]|nr:TylF/MycF family methyltransferase [Alkalimonas sp.]